MSNFPTSLDTGVSLPTPSAANNTNSPSHAGLHGAENAAIIATETKLGIGATTPAANQLLVGTGAGTSAWQGLTSAQLLAILSDETGSGSAVFANTPVLITPKVDTINENTTNNGVTVGGVNLKAGAISTASSVPAGAIQAGAVGSPALAVGVSVQTVATMLGAMSTGTSLIPYDNTIPQNTEGTQILTVSITPKATTNRLSIEALVLASSTASNHLQIALFQDATANALAANAAYQTIASGAANVRLMHDMAAGTTSSTTFAIRLGQESAGTWTLNGQSGVVRYGGISVSGIRVTEYKG